jgi:hypothetical protein
MECHWVLRGVLSVNGVSLGVAWRVECEWSVTGWDVSGWAFTLLAAADDHHSNLANLLGERCEYEY